MKNSNKEEESKFSNKVYKAVKKIPKGKTSTYKEIAKIIGHPGAWRGVGNILNKNKDPKIPCHRVIRSDGKVGGYNQGQRKKIILLKKEGIILKKGCFDFAQHKFTRYSGYYSKPS